MKRLLTGTCLAATFAVGLAAQSPATPQTATPQYQPSMQEPKAAAKSITVTGCLKAGDTPESFILSDLKWSDKSKTSDTTGVVGTSGSTVPPAVASATTLKIIPSPSTKLIEHIGHTVEITGAVSDKDKADRDATTTTPDPASTRPSTASGPSVTARNVKMVSETCSPQ
jgi:hypothetical protein